MGRRITPGISLTRFRKAHLPTWLLSVLSQSVHSLMDFCILRRIRTWMRLRNFVTNQKHPCLPVLTAGKQGLSRVVPPSQFSVVLYMFAKSASDGGMETTAHHSGGYQGSLGLTKFLTLFAFTGFCLLKSELFFQGTGTALWSKRCGLCHLFPLFKGRWFLVFQWLERLCAQELECGRGGSQL